MFLSLMDRKRQKQTEKKVWTGAKSFKKNMFSISAFIVPTGRRWEKCQTVQYADEDTDEHRRKVEDSARNTSVA